MDVHLTNSDLFDTLFLYMFCSIQKYITLWGYEDYEDFISFWDGCWSSTDMHAQQHPPTLIGENKRIFIL